MGDRFDPVAAAERIDATADTHPMIARAAIIALHDEPMRDGARPGAATLGSGDGDYITRRDLRQLANELLIIAGE